MVCLYNPLFGVPGAASKAGRFTCRCGFTRKRKKCAFHAIKLLIFAHAGEHKFNRNEYLPDAGSQTMQSPPLSIDLNSGYYYL